MRELVREHALELAWCLLECAAHWNPDAAVVDGRCPRRRPRGIAELLRRIQHDGDDVLREGIQSGSDAPVGGFEKINRLARHGFVRRSFE